MHLFIKPVEEYEQRVREYYTRHGSFHEGDSGLDLFCLQDLTIPARTFSVKMPLGICTEAQSNTSTPVGYYLYPRSSLGAKTPIRLANSVGIIDAGYRGQLTALLDNPSDQPFTLKSGERYFQICAPDLSPLQFTLTDQLSDTDRGQGGMGSTGN